MISKHSHRKDEHVSLAEKFYQPKHVFQDIRFIHQSLPKYSLADIDLSTTIGRLKLTAPFYIEAISGGSPRTSEINAKLATVAQATGIAMAVGSQSVALSDPSLADTFRVVRKNNPNGIIFANIGGNRSAEDAKRAVQMIDADALEVHVNVTQELIMPEGDRQFNFQKNIKEMVDNLTVPVIVKEVGFGMSRETIAELVNLGVRYVNVSGHGGTNFATIENFRRADKSMTYLADWGLTTPETLLESRSYQDQLTVLASGGVQTPLDVAKCLALGSSAVGVAGQFLHMIIHEDPADIIDEVNNWKNGLQAIMMMTNTRTISEFKKTEIVLSPELLSYQNQRHLGEFND